MELLSTYWTPRPVGLIWLCLPNVTCDWQWRILMQVSSTGPSTTRTHRPIWTFHFSSSSSRFTRAPYQQSDCCGREHKLKICAVCRNGTVTPVAFLVDVTRGAISASAANVDPCNAPLSAYFAAFVVSKIAFFMVAAS